MTLEVLLMPSPFPGMDPYLEHPTLWSGVHQRLITYLGDALNALLPPHYVADIGERLYVVQSERSIYPDVVVVEPPAAVFLSEGGTSSAATVLTSDPPWVLTVEPIEKREVFIEILSVGDPSRVVTVIEVLSPSNKTAGSEGRQLYVTKQHEILQSPTHLLEIDLLHYGEHTVAAPRVHLIEQGTWTYLVCLHRGGQRRRFEVWAITLRQRLPRIRVPLAHGDADVVLDLQTVFDRCYDEGAYARRLDYRRDPPTLLSGDDLAWVTTLLKEQGRRN
jgi:Protein of unknown function (DUF4058)